MRMQIADANRRTEPLSSLHLPVAAQMAIDAHLLSQVAVTGRLVFRTYSMSPPAVTIGRHQRWNRVVDEYACSRSGWEWWRRPSGGGALLHKNEINYAVVAPRGALAPVGEGEFRNVFDLIGCSLTSSLSSMGIESALHSGDRSAHSSQHGLCGRSITGNEIARRGRKIVAAAQLITPTGILQHGTIYLNAPTVADRFWPKLPSDLGHESDAQRWSDLGPELRERGQIEVAAMIEGIFARNLPVACHPCELKSSDWSAVEALLDSWVAAGWNKSR